jgi:hypothetical protein
MVLNKSRDEYNLIAALLSDVQTLHSEVLSPRALRLTTQVVSKRLAREGIGFLTKTLPRLGKALDRALSGEVQLDAASLAFDSLPNSKLPRFLGELFQLIFAHSGWVLPTPCVRSIQTLRQVLYLFYKYKLPYSLDLEQDVIDQFLQTEQDILPYNQYVNGLFHEQIGEDPNAIRAIKHGRTRRLLQRARRLLSDLFSSFDVDDISPKHGPGAVSTRESLWGKYNWTKVSPRIASVYPFDTYFCASMGHVCDKYRSFKTIDFVESSARVILVPKDSRGPRLISCEPLDFQWIQQGLGSAIVRHVESHPLTRWNVNFTDQNPNRIGALYGSSTGRYATLDLKEASDRVSVGLVRLLFPEPLLGRLKACRSLSTTLPDGRVIVLNKFAPMGSALCFPILALTVWALLSSGCWDAYPTRGDRHKRRSTLDGILVYGDDVIVPTDYSAHAIELLEAFGLKVNRAKSCTSGFFRESCGMDAYKGIDVTPVRLRTVWSSRPSPDVYASYIAYANAFFHKHYHNTYDFIVGNLCRVYRDIPEQSVDLSSALALIMVPEAYRSKKRRYNKDLQRFQTYIWDIRPRTLNKEIDGWSMLLRYFVDSGFHPSLCGTNDRPRRSGVADQADLKLGPFWLPDGCLIPYSVRSYTKRRATKLARAWR